MQNNMQTPMVRYNARSEEDCFMDHTLHVAKRVDKRLGMQMHARERDLQLAFNRCNKANPQVMRASTSV